MRAAGASTRRLVLPLFGVALAGCDGGSDQLGSATVSVDTTATGVIQVSYSAIPAAPSFELREDLRIGRDPDVVFGDIRGIELAGDTAVLILDAQASELRSFDLSGVERALLARKGEGPHEIVSANGIRIDHEGAVWINDHGKGRLTRLLPGGGVETMPRFVHSYGFRWEGGVTVDGRLWSHQTHSVTPTGPREPGIAEGVSRSYFLAFDPDTQATDSVLLGEDSYKSIALPRGGVSMPFMPNRLQSLDPAGAIWTAWSGTYRLARLDPSEDTTLIVDVAAVGPAVSPEERAEEIADIEEFMETAGRVHIDWDAVIPETKPVLRQLVVDDHGNVWAQREVEERTIFDGFGPEGLFLGHIVLPYTVSRYVPPVMKAGWFVGLHTDALGVQSVIGSRLPSALLQADGVKSDMNQEARP